MLLALVIAKLYLWDVWQLTRVYLVTAFIALGVILLVASFIYSRFRMNANARRNRVLLLRQPLDLFQFFSRFRPLTLRAEITITRQVVPYLL